MPFLRVIRDKRGYETTYLMHIYRDGTRQRTKILYVFRTPGGVRVGRDPLEPDVQRQIEAQCPDISFNWAAVRDTQQLIETAAEPRRRRPKRDDEPARSEAAAPVVLTSTPPSTPRETPPPPRVVIPSAIEGATPDEQIAFLNRWYPVVKERIAGRPFDPMRVEALTALADRMNPLAWTDADQITTGLQSAAEALERLSRVFAKRRRRSRRRAVDSRSEQNPAPTVAPVQKPDATS